ncbi:MULTISPECIES: trimeric intracellular cation channel family protein [Pseudovibrio]|uniref:trimeric intracellular cation channel family protein n=1 Tax=Stappiaceae TaxID=2821832 RepID=UPI002365B332|nr:MULTISPECIES: trimeric intracellular cation channel family protein [Pseudovibrio]MDD7909783.1 trimeric intracellular cation channel family protein [Pseudovibrio exalbescens]MDX5592123.1 trimeric intracellular cation channel family protein [Pseudovibrio sp. SPO723]
MIAWQYLDYLGVAVFAITGGLVAARLRQDLIAFLFFCTLTGIGGGTLRDVLLDAPVFWTQNESYLIICGAVAVLMWFTAHIWERLDKPIRWMDALGIAAYCVMGAAKALTFGEAYFVAILMGVATATCGGIIRDIVAGQPSAISQREVYVAATFAGATAYVVVHAFALGDNWAALAGFSVAMLLRGGALTFGWSLPTYLPPADRKKKKQKAD